jgi:hypothetical protein
MPPGGCWACETTCQIGCELFCTTQFELNGIVFSPSTHHGTVPHTTPHATTPHETTPPATTPAVTTGPHTTAHHTTVHHTTPHPTTAHHTTVHHTTPEPTEPHTTAHPTAPHTTAHPTAPHTTAHPTAPHTTAHPTAPHTTRPHTTPHPTSPPTAPTSCPNCAGHTTPLTIQVHGADGSHGTLTKIGSCQYHGDIYTAGGSLRGLLTLTFNPWSINMTFDYTGDGTAYGTITPEPHPYNCLSTLAIEFETVTYTLTPS